MDHKGLPVKGYGDQSDEKVQLVNENKVIEEKVLRQIDKVREANGSDYEMAKTAELQIKQAFMWLNRAVFQPSRVDLPEDKEN